MPAYEFQIKTEWGDPNLYSSDSATATKKGLSNRPPAKWTNFLFAAERYSDSKKSVWFNAYVDEMGNSRPDHRAASYSPTERLMAEANWTVGKPLLLLPIKEYCIPIQYVEWIHSPLPESENSVAHAISDLKRALKGKELQVIAWQDTANDLEEEIEELREFANQDDMAPNQNLLEELSTRIKTLAEDLKRTFNEWEQSEQEVSRLNAIAKKQKTRIAELEIIVENSIDPISNTNLGERGINLKVTRIKADQYVHITDLALDGLRCLIRWTAVGFIAHQITGIFV